MRRSPNKATRQPQRPIKVLVKCINCYLQTLLVVITWSLAITALTLETENEAKELVAQALDQARGVSSFAKLTMTIKRPNWTRISSFEVWAKGRDNALIRFTAPAREVGNATLKNGDHMWTYSTKIGREVRLPRSMMSQGWAGSDLSYNDLARTDQILKHYAFSLTQTNTEDQYTVYTVEAIPHENAPVVWGKEVFEIREDLVILNHSYFDQDLELVKTIETLEIAEFDDREIPQLIRVTKVEDEDSWTEVEYVDIDFDVEIPDDKFTLYSLRGLE